MTKIKVLSIDAKGVLDKHAGAYTSTCLYYSHVHVPELVTTLLATESVLSTFTCPFLSLPVPPCFFAATPPCCVTLSTFARAEEKSKYQAYTRHKMSLPLGFFFFDCEVGVEAFFPATPQYTS